MRSLLSISSLPLVIVTQDDYAVNGKLQKKKRKAPEGRRDRTADGVAWCARHC